MCVCVRACASVCVVNRNISGRGDAKLRVVVFPFSAIIDACGCCVFFFFLIGEIKF